LPRKQKSSFIKTARRDGTPNRDMKKDDEGTWYISINKDLKGIFYAFSVKVNDTWLNEVPDPYAKRWA
jgi:1,4-alpha-glucan branching enzyme